MSITWGVPNMGLTSDRPAGNSTLNAATIIKDIFVVNLDGIKKKSTSNE